VLVNNAGYGMVGAIEETSIDEARAIFDTNVFGLLQVSQAVLPHLRARRQGHIINLSSGAGIGAVPGLGIYSATKFAVEGLSEALAGEVAGLGIRVSLVEPGAVLTNFPSGSIVETQKKIADYAPVSGHGRAGVQKFYEMQAASPETVANAIIALADDSSSSLRLIVGGDALQGVQRKLDQLHKELQYSTDVMAAV
jgi:short-subunit dehydrogenase